MLVILCLVFYLIGFMLRTVRYGAQQCWLFPRSERLAGALAFFYTSLSPSFLIQLEYKISSFNEAFVGENTRKNLHQDRQPGNGKQAMTEIQNLSLAVRRRPNASNRTTKVSKILNFLFDALAGVTFYLVTRNFYPPDSLACYFVLCRDSTHHFLSILLEWLMGAPAGLKLSHELTMFLGNFFQYHIYIWIGYLSILEPFYALIINSIMCSSFLGLSVMLSLASDFLSFLTFHTYCFYVYAGKIYQLQLQGLISLSRLMRGKKWNPLRDRVDSIPYDANQLAFGTILFTILLFLLPTTGVYYLVFTFLRLPVIVLKTIIYCAVKMLNTIPAYEIFQKIFKSREHLDGISLDLCYGKQCESIMSQDRGASKPTVPLDDGITVAVRYHDISMQSLVTRETDSGFQNLLPFSTLFKSLLLGSIVTKLYVE